MGDIADDHYDRMIDEMCEEGYGFRAHRAFFRQPQCNRCGTYDVFWRPLKGRKYRLYNLNGTEHHCNPADPDDFEGVSHA